MVLNHYLTNKACNKLTNRYNKNMKKQFKINIYNLINIPHANEILSDCLKNQIKVKPRNVKFNLGDISKNGEVIVSATFTK